MSTYATVLAFSLAGPLLFSFLPRFHFVPRWPLALATTLLVAPAFLVWDLLATQAGHWSFSHEHTWSLRLAGLPLEEILFFMVAPFCCLFVQHCLVTLGKGSRDTPPWVPALLAALCVAAAIAVWPRMYTVVVLLFAAVFFVLLATVWKGRVASSRFWLTQAVCFLPFLIVNGVLTGVPVVTYSPEAILGPRILSIPIEDCLYSFVLVGSNALIFDSLKKS